MFTYVMFWYKTIEITALRIHHITEISECLILDMFAIRFFHSCNSCSSLLMSEVRGHK